MSDNMDKQIRHLSYQVFRKLSHVLDPPGPMDWKALIGVMPEGTYTTYQVIFSLLFEMSKMLLTVFQMQFPLK